MSNQNYSQVTSLVADGLLKWDRDRIMALLVQNASFDGGHERVSDVECTMLREAMIQGCWIHLEGDEAWGMGQPVGFQQVPPDQAFQVLVTQDDGRFDNRLLAFIDSDHSGTGIHVQRAGSLIIRPSQENPPVPPETLEQPPIVGYWLKL